MGLVLVTIARNSRIGWAEGDVGRQTTMGADKACTLGMDGGVRLCGVHFLVDALRGSADCVDTGNSARTGGWAGAAAWTRVEPLQCSSRRVPWHVVPWRPGPLVPDRLGAAAASLDRVEIGLIGEAEALRGLAVGGHEADASVGMWSITLSLLPKLHNPLTGTPLFLCIASRLSRNWHYGPA